MAVEPFVKSSRSQQLSFGHCRVLCSTIWSVWGEVVCAHGWYAVYFCDKRAAHYANNRLVVDRDQLAINVSQWLPSYYTGARFAPNKKGQSICVKLGWGSWTKVMTIIRGIDAPDVSLWFESARSADCQPPSRYLWSCELTPKEWKGRVGTNGRVGANKMAARPCIKPTTFKLATDLMRLR